MTDVVDKATRSRMMSSIRGKNTKPEMAVRRYLHAAGFRYSLHRDDLPGTPDLVLKKYRLIIFVHGCFWHRHDGCYYATSPASRKEEWASKLDGNRKRDQEQQRKLGETGWRVLTIWECGLKHTPDKLEEIIGLIVGEQPVAEWPLEPPRKRHN